MATAPVNTKSNKTTYQDGLKKISKEFEAACNELKQPSTVNINEINEYKTIENTTAKWDKHKNPNKDDCAVAKTIIKCYHCSNKIRQKLTAFIPSDYPLHYCCFSKGAVCCPGFNRSSFLFLHGTSLLSLFAVAVECNQKSASSILKQIIGSKQFDFILKSTCNGNTQHFYVKMVGDAAFVKACGTSQRTDCMTFAPVFAIKLHEYGLLVLKATKGLLGVGFCNLIEDPRRTTKRRNVIKGKSMIMIRNDNIQHIEIEFYGKNGVNSNDFGASCVSNNLSKNGYDNPLVLYPQTIDVTQVNVEQKVQEQNTNTGTVPSEFVAPNQMFNDNGNFFNGSVFNGVPQPNYNYSNNSMIFNQFPVGSLMLCLPAPSSVHSQIKPSTYSNVHNNQENNQENNQSMWRYSPY